MEKISEKIKSAEALTEAVARWRAAGEVIVFTNGCFDRLPKRRASSK
jgi:bifunctional ADP-heptose synthase (sugar kinase/adenylyltransferase)